MSQDNIARGLGSTAPDSGTAEGFYGDFWASEQWGSESPNVDELARLHAIRQLIETRVVPYSETTALRILDVGCGRGWLTNALSGYGSAIGADVVEAAVARATQLFPDLAFHQGDGTALLGQFGEGSFDLVVSSEVIEHVPGPMKRAFLADITRLVRRRGYVILTTPRGECFDGWRERQRTVQPVEEWLTKKELLRITAEAGLECVAHKRIFAPGVAFDSFSRVVAGRSFCRLMDRMPNAPLLGLLRRRAAIYQIGLFRNGSI